MPPDQVRCSSCSSRSCARCPSSRDGSTRRISIVTTPVSVRSSPSNSWRPMPNRSAFERSSLSICRHKKASANRSSTGTSHSRSAVSGCFSRSHWKVSARGPSAWSSRLGRTSPNLLASVSRGSRSTSPIVQRPRVSSRSRTVGVNRRAATGRGDRAKRKVARSNERGGGRVGEGPGPSHRRG